MHSADYEPNMKTELCYSFIYNGHCEKGDSCFYAHGYSELSANSIIMKQNKNKIKTRKCGPFYSDKVCLYGARCLFRHEFRAYNTIFRHYYVPHLYALE